MVTLTVTISCQHCHGTGQATGLNTCEDCHGDGIHHSVLTLDETALSALRMALTTLEPATPPPAPAQPQIVDMTSYVEQA